MIHDFKELLKQPLWVGKILKVHIAHVFSFGTWKRYTFRDYQIYDISSKEIKLVNTDHPTEHLSITDKMMNGYLKVEL